MKRIIYIIAILGLTINFSCDDYLDRYPLDEISPNSFWKTENDLQIGLNNLYPYLNMDAWNEDIRSADVYVNGGNIISSGTLAPSDNDSEQIWNTAYEQLRAVHEFLDQYEQAEVSTETLERYRGEALFFRAFFHYQLLKHFGDVPMVTTLLDVDDEEIYGTRNDRAEVMEQIITDLTEASILLPTSSWLAQNRPGEVGRITQGATLALLSRAALFEGTFQKYHLGNSGNEFLQVAVDASQELIDSDEYALANNFDGLILPEGSYSQEIILAYRYSDIINTSNPRPSTTVEVSGFMPTKKLADAFLSTDGLPIEDSPLFKGYETLTSEFEDRDPRMTKTFWVPGSDDHPLAGEENGAPILSVGPTGYYFSKGAMYSAYQSDVFVDEVIFRYGEVLLNNAEALYELNGNISDNQIEQTINQLRERVDMEAKLSNSFVDNNGLSMLEEIRRERRVELAAEGFRYDDLIRWKEAENELPTSIRGIKFQEEVYPNLVIGEDVQLDEEGFVIAQSSASRFFDPEKNYLFPLPPEQLRLNPNLTDNPNWSN